MAVIDLVDRVLRRWGKGPAKWPDDDIPATPNASIEYKAYLVLDEVHRREIRSDRWNIFRVRNRKLSPDINSQISPASTLDNIRAGSKSAHLNITKRNGKLYNVDDDTNEFTHDVYVDANEFVAIDNCPAYYQDWVVEKAALEFGQSHWHSVSVDRREYEVRKAEIRNDERQMYALARRIDGQQKAVNFFDAADSRRVLGDRHTAPTRRHV